AGHRRHAVKNVVQPAVEVETHDVLDVLPAPDEPVPVRHLGVARDGTYPRVGKRAHEPGEGVGLELCVGVDTHDELVASQAQPGVEGGGLAGVDLTDDLDAAFPQALDDVGRAVGRAVVDDDHFQGAIATARQRGDGGGDADGL